MEGPVKIKSTTGLLPVPAPRERSGRFLHPKVCTAASPLSSFFWMEALAIAGVDPADPQLELQPLLSDQRLQFCLEGQVR